MGVPSTLTCGHLWGDLGPCAHELKELSSGRFRAPGPKDDIIWGRRTLWQAMNERGPFLWELKISFSGFNKTWDSLGAARWRSGQSSGPRGRKNWAQIRLLRVVRSIKWDNIYYLALVLGTKESLNKCLLLSFLRKKWMARFLASWCGGCRGSGQGEGRPNAPTPPAPLTLLSRLKEVEGRVWPIGQGSMSPKLIHPWSYYSFFFFGVKLPFFLKTWTF